MAFDLLQRRLTISEHVRTTSVDGSLVVIDMKQGQYFGLDDVGAVIWRLLEEGLSGGVIVLKIAEDYDAAVALVEADTRRIVQELLDAGLVQDRVAMPHS